MKETVSILPDPHVIQSIRNTRITYGEALSEFLDNGFDAGATEIVIDIRPNHVGVRDNGQGCSDLSAMLALGKHRRSVNTKLGRYGVGLKNAAIGLGEILEIRSCKAGVARSVSIDWTCINDDWSVEAETNPTTDEGTFITVAQLLKTRVGNIEALISELAFRFRPALVSGKRILFNHGDDQRELEAEPLPEFEDDAIDQQTALNGLSFTVRAGIIRQGQELNRHKPFIIQYEHRVLFDTDEPCGEYLASERFLAMVELHGNWPLLKHKDGLSDKAEWLFSELTQICEPLLQRVTEEGENLDLADIEAEINEEFNSLLGRETRRGGDTTATVNPTGAGSPRLNAMQVRGRGSVAGRNEKPHGVNITFAPLDQIIGKVSANRKRIQITLNRDHPAVDWHRTRRQMWFIKHTAIALLASFRSSAYQSGQQQFLPGLVGQNDHETFVNILGHWCGEIALREKEKREVA